MQLFAHFRTAFLEPFIVSTAMDDTKFKYDKKVKGVVVERTVVYGSEAYWLGRHAGEGVSTHKW